MDIMHDVYLAGPWFTKEQLAVAKAVESACELQGRSFFSPRLRCLVAPGASRYERFSAFAANCTGIEAARVVLANIDNYDPGTIWEIGYAYAKTKIIAYSMVPGRKMNLMLAESCDGFLNGQKQIEQFLEKKKGDTLSFQWALAKQWEKAVV